MWRVPLAGSLLPEGARGFGYLAGELVGLFRPAGTFSQRFNYRVAPEYRETWLLVSPLGGRGVKLTAYGATELRTPRIGVLIVRNIVVP